MWQPLVLCTNSVLHVLQCQLVLHTKMQGKEGGREEATKYWVAVSIKILCKVAWSERVHQPEVRGCVQTVTWSERVPTWNSLEREGVCKLSPGARGCVPRNSIYFLATYNCPYWVSYK